MLARARLGTALVNATAAVRRKNRGLMLACFTIGAAACGPAGGEPAVDQAQAAQPADAGMPASERGDVGAESERGDVGVATEPGGSASQIDWDAVESAFGRSGSMQTGEVFKFGMPRTDLNVTADGVQIAPALALGSWLAFRERGEGGTVAMGDLVLTEEELGRVIARLQQGGVGQTAVHKHLPEMSPAVWWTHIHAEGDPVEIAGTVRAALELTGTPPEGQPPAAAADLAIDTAEISRILGYSGGANGGVYKLAVARAETIRASGIEVPASMGTATAINFQPTGNGRAAINGDFVMTAGEVQGVLGALEEHGIAVVALHNHMLTEEPRLFFVHFWANDDAIPLARGLRAALDRVNVQSPADR